jgi:pyruvate,orthophosphate dikinase
MADDPGFPLTREDAVRRVLPLLQDAPMVATVASIGAQAEPLAKGLAASPGIACGEIVTSPEEAVRLAEAGRTVILVRNETSPDDVHGMAKAAGILTAQGGIASHAAVVARGWGIPAVVGVSNLSVGDRAISVEGVELRSGELLTIDGSTGAVYRGRVESSTEVVPAARTLMKWADELGIPISGTAAQDAPGSPGGEAKADAPEPSPAEARPGSAAPPEVSRDDVLHLVGVKGFGTPQAISEALRADPAESEARLDELVGEGVATISAGAYRLTDRGLERRAALLAREREAIPADVRATLLEAFATLDGRMKEIVTAWQMRESGPGVEPVLNDHADADYDRGVLDRLEALASDADSWLGDLITWPRSTAYRARLTRALEQASAGDPRYVASPRVDSYHGVWFELHEDLIELAGSTRAEEVAAGRA